MSAFQVLQSIPRCFIAGEVIEWTETEPDYPDPTYSIAYRFFGNTPLDGQQQFTITGTGSGANYTFTTANDYKPGNYGYEKQVTRASDSAMRVIGGGFVLISPNLSTPQTITFAAAQVTLLEGVIAAFSASPDKTVSFNGQSFERDSLKDYQAQLVTYQAQVIREQVQWQALLGINRGNRVAQVFVSPTTQYGPNGYGSVNPYNW